MKCTSQLSEDHKAILRAVEVLRAMAERTERGEMVQPDDVRAVTEFLKEFADELHQGKEECVLFPALLAAGEKVDAGPLRAMLFEHDCERSLVEGLEEAMYSAKTHDFIYFANRLADILENHIYKEEKLLFRIIEKILPAEEDVKVSRSFSRWDEDRQAKSAHLKASLRDLEYRYLSRRAEVVNGE